MTMRKPGTKCPHAKIQYCPLYIGMHIAGGPSCWPKNGDLDEGCAVDQGSSYEDLVAKFFRAHPQEFAEVTLRERADEARLIAWLSDDEPQDWPLPAVAQKE